MKQLTKKIKSGVFLGTLVAVSFTLTAKPALKTIKAYLNPTISYTLNGEKVLEDTKTINYDNKTYIPLADVAKIMDMQIKLENNTMIMTTKTATQPGEEKESVLIPEAIIKAVDAAHKKVIILKKESEDKIENYIVLNISDQTKISHEENKKVYTVEDLKTDMRVSVTHAKEMTYSLPPQTSVFEIKMLTVDTGKTEEEKDDADKKDKEDDEDEKDDKGEKQTTLKNVRIIEVNNGAKYIVVEAAAKDKGSFKIAFDNKIKIKYEGEKKQPNVNALKAGQMIDIKIGNSDSELFKILEVTVKK
ncbi:hypothetical protein [Cellulosilyticum sp. I15G10I2]|uniref:hypothetical protein n=1 Tax=Cellulosilyticum sp. I15G10I2 TaxID=1892843 RepID=UPI00085BD3C7|nr:hypothetical protein [Cellulosilyticum sp. I15G10I2]